MRFAAGFFGDLVMPVGVFFIGLAVPVGVFFAALFFAVAMDHSPLKPIRPPHELEMPDWDIKFWAASDGFAAAFFEAFLALAAFFVVAMGQLAVSTPRTTPEARHACRLHLERAVDRKRPA